MMLIILDKDPVKAVELIPNKIKHKQLIELCQMLSTINDDGVYKLIKQGKAIMEWIKLHRSYVYAFAMQICYWSLKNINISLVSREKIFSILKQFEMDLDTNYVIKTAIFRYQKEYTDTKYATDSELPIDVAIEEYKRYVAWKKTKSERWK